MDNLQICKKLKILLINSTRCPSILNMYICARFLETWTELHTVILCDTNIVQIYSNLYIIVQIIQFCRM